MSFKAWLGTPLNTQFTYIRAMIQSVSLQVKWSLNTEWGRGDKIGVT